MEANPNNKAPLMLEPSRPSPFRSAWKIAAVFGLAILAGAAALWAWRIPAASWVLDRELAQLGFPDAQVRIARLQFDHVELAPLRLGRDLAAERISFRFDLDDLRHARYERTSVRVHGLDVDISTPDTGALGQLRRLAAAGSRDDKPGALPPLPSVALSNVRVHGRTGPAAPEFRFDGKSRVSGDSLEFSLSNARLSDTRDVPLFDAVEIAAEGTLKDGKARMKSRLSAGSGYELHIEGNLDLQADRGRIEWHLPETIIDPDRNPLSGLSPILDPAGNMGGTMKADGWLLAEAGAITGQLTATASNITGTRREIAVTNAGGRLAASFSGPEQRLDFSLTDAAADIAAQGHAIAVRSLRARGNVAKIGNTAGASAILSHAVVRSGDTPRRFPDITLNGEFAAPEFAQVVANLTARALDRRLTAKVLADQDLITGKGKAMIMLDPLRFVPGKLQPKHLNAGIGIAGDLDGTVSAVADFGWRENGVSGKAEARLADLGFSTPDLRLRKLNGTLSAGPIEPGKPIRFRLSTGGSELSAGGREFALGPTEIDGSWHDGGYAATAKLDRLSHVALQPIFQPLALELTADGNASEIRFQADISQKGALRLSARGRTRLAENDTNVHVELPPIRFSETGLKPDDLSPILALADSVAGTLKGDADVRVKSGEVSGGARISAEEFDIRVGETAIEAFTGGIDLAQLMPPLTRGPQTLGARRIDAGLAFLNPVISYRVEPSPDGPLPRLAILSATVGVADGRISMRPTHFDANRDAHEFGLDLEGVELKQLIGLLAIKGVSAEGRVSGRLPIHISRERVFVRDGRLETAGPGVLRLRSEAARQALAGGGAQVDLVLEVLKDFHYTKLAITLDRLDDGRDVVRLSTEGHNPAVQNGRHVNLNVNLETNLDKLLAIAREGYRLSQDALRATLDSVSRK